MKGADARWVKCTWNSRTPFGTKVHATCHYRGVASDMKLLESALEINKVPSDLYPAIARRWLQHVRDDYRVRKVPYVMAIIDEFGEAPVGTNFDASWLNRFHAKFDKTLLRSR